MEITLTPIGRALGTIPQRAHPTDAGLDLRAAIEQPVTVGATPVLIPCGFTVAIPIGYCGMVCSRSGLALKFGVSVTNAPGIIDSDYRGEVGVVLWRPFVSAGAVSHESCYRVATEDPRKEFVVNPGDKIAQLLIVPVALDLPIVVDALSSTDRGTSGFGSTGR